MEWQLENGIRTQSFGVLQKTGSESYENTLRLETIRKLFPIET